MCTYCTIKSNSLPPERYQQEEEVLDSSSTVICRCTTLCLFLNFFFYKFFSQQQFRQKLTVRTPLHILLIPSTKTNICTSSIIFLSLCVIWSPQCYLENFISTSFSLHFQPFEELGTASKVKLTYALCLSIVCPRHKCKGPKKKQYFGD